MRERQNRSLLLPGRKEVAGEALNTCCSHGHDAVAEQGLCLAAGTEEQITAQQRSGTFWPENKGTLSHPYPRKSAKRSKTCLSASKHIGLALQGNSAVTALCKISMFSSEFSLQNVEKMCNFFPDRVLRKVYWFIYLLSAPGYRKIMHKKK